MPAQAIPARPPRNGTRAGPPARSKEPAQARSFLRVLGRRTSGRAAGRADGRADARGRGACVNLRVRLRICVSARAR
eukprot:7585435-Alexandrium_andersonii.AAC.1